MVVVVFRIRFRSPALAMLIGRSDNHKCLGNVSEHKQTQKRAPSGGQAELNHGPCDMRGVSLTTLVSKGHPHESPLGPSGHVYFSPPPIEAPEIQANSVHSVSGTLGSL